MLIWTIFSSFELLFIWTIDIMYEINKKKVQLNIIYYSTNGHKIGCNEQNNSSNEHNYRSVCQCSWKVARYQRIVQTKA